MPNITRKHISWLTSGITSNNHFLFFLLTDTFSNFFPFFFLEQTSTIHQPFFSRGRGRLPRSPSCVGFILPCETNHSFLSSLQVHSVWWSYGPAQSSLSGSLWNNPDPVSFESIQTLCPGLRSCLVFVLCRLLNHDVCFSFKSWSHFWHHVTCRVWAVCI